MVCVVIVFDHVMCPIGAQQSEILREADAMAMLDHANIVRLYGKLCFLSSTTWWAKRNSQGREGLNGRCRVCSLLGT